MAAEAETRARVASRCALAAAVAYLVVALWVMRDILPAPSELMLSRPRVGREAALIDADQRMVVSVVERNARLLPTRPWAIAQDGQCYPTPRAYTLGEHMLGNGLLAALPYWISGDPILAFNALLLLSLWIPGLTMYALSFHFTRSAAAAFVAGLCFAFTPIRLLDCVHPYVHGDLWTPLALLFLHRLFVRRTWASALGFMVFFSLEILESLYAVLSSALLVAVLGLYLSVRYRRHLGAIAAKLLLCIGAPAVVAWLVFAPYLGTAATWSVLRRDYAYFANQAEFLPGNRYFPGAVVTLLCLIGLVDRFRGARAARGYDPRFVFLVAGLFVLWASCYAIDLPLLGKFTSPLRLARDFVPGLDAVRVLSAVRLGLYLSTAFLAGYGVLALVERLRPRPQVVLAGVLSIALLAELLTPALATLSFTQPFTWQAIQVRPPSEQVELVTRAAERGAVLDLPHQARNLEANSRYLLLSAYHHRPLAACYNSFRTPVQQQLEQLGKAVPTPQALEALAAMGFETIFVHRDQLPKRDDALPQQIDEVARSGGRLAKLGSAGDIDAYRLSAPAVVQRDVLSLGPPQVAPASIQATPPESPLTLTIENRSGQTFAHPDPITPTELVARWQTPDGAIAMEEPTRALLPLALAPGAATTIDVTMRVPGQPGAYDLVLARVGRPDAVLARARVEVAPEPPHQRGKGGGKRRSKRPRPTATAAAALDRSEGAMHEVEARESPPGRDP